MEFLGSYWLRRLLVEIPPLAAYEGQDTRTGMPVLVLVHPQGTPVEAPGVLRVLEVLEGAWVLEWPLGAVPLSAYLGVADPERLYAWASELAAILQGLKAKGLSYAVRPELTLVKGRRVWVAGAGLKALEGEPEGALLALVQALAGPRYGTLPWREALERGEGLPRDGARPSPQAPNPQPVALGEGPAGPGKALPVVVGGEGLGAGNPKEASQGSAPGTPIRKIRLEDAEHLPPSFLTDGPSRPRLGRRWVLGGLLLLGLAALWGFRGGWTRGGGPYPMEFRVDPPTVQAEVYLLEVPQGSRMQPGTLLLTAPGQAEFDVKGVYRVRIRVSGREPVDYLLEVPSPPLTIRVP